MKKPVFFLLSLLMTLTISVYGEQEAPMRQLGTNERRLSVDGREMVHMHLHTTPLYGNSTDFMYYYITMYFGSHRQPQTLIVDTGSSVAAIPCKKFCDKGSCGHHINELYESTKSENFKLYDCQTVECRCATDNRCRFYQGYAEGSRYEGYVAKDSLYFGENFHFGVDMFEYTFGCVHTETKYFYSQDADGILGLSAERPKQNLNRFEPIYDVMHEQGIIEKRQFSMCLGKNGGYFQIGGYDETGALRNEEIKWIKMLYANNDFKIPMRSIMMNNHLMDGTSTQKIAFVDSGTTFTYLNTASFNAIKLHFEWYCSLEPEKHCKGKMNFTRRGYLCFGYSEKEFPSGPYDYFRSFPILRFNMGTEEENVTIDWYPSEYLYREHANSYCVAIDLQNGSEMLLGGTLMRQHNFVFDLDNQRLGVQRASCSQDPNQVKYEKEMILAGQRYALDPTHTASVGEVCNHSGSVVKRPPRQHHSPDPQPKYFDQQEPEPTEPEKPTDDGTNPTETNQNDTTDQTPEEEEKTPESKETEVVEVTPSNDTANATISEVDESNNEPDVVDSSTLPIFNLPPDPEPQDTSTKTFEPEEDHHASHNLVNGQEKSIEDIKNEKNSTSEVEARKKHSDGGFPAWIIPVLIVMFVASAFIYICRRYCKGRGERNPLERQRPYSQSDQRDATVADTVPDGFGDSNAISSARQNRGRQNSERSSDQHQLELQADSQERQPETVEDDEEQSDDSEGSSPGEHHPQARV